ncbi:MAG TPA: CHAD domain-containing protein [Candidatus Angelobacter sp.]|jgi:CHAD domain-containing protein
MALLEKRMLGLTADLSAAVAKLADEKVSPKNVHWLRTTIRRIESLVSYANPDLDKKLERSLEKTADLRKRAGKVRDFDVQISLLDVLANGSTARDRRALAELLGNKRDRQAARLVAAVKKVQDSKFFARMTRIAHESAVVPEGKNRPLAPLEEAKAQLSVMAHDFSSHNALKTSRLHDARVSLKRIRYLAELADESSQKQDFISELKTVQNAVGDWHDWQELTRTAEKRFSDRVNCAMLREVRALLAARHATATSSINNLFASALAQTKKPPRSAQPDRALAQHA